MTKSAAKSLSVGEINSLLGKRIKKIREESNITQEQLSETADISQNFISQLENGRKSASIDTLFKIASAMEVPICVLFDFIDEKPSGTSNNNHIEKKIAFLTKSLKTKEKAILLDLVKLLKKHNK